MSGLLELRTVGELEPDVPPGTSRFSSAGVPSATMPAVVEHRDPMREPVGLLEVLGRQEDRDPARDEVADRPAHIVRRLRGSSPAVGSSRKMIRGLPTRVIARSSLRCIPPDSVETGLPAASRQVELVEQLCGPTPALASPEVAQVGHQEQVLLAGEEPVDGRELAGDADRGTDAVRVAGQVVARRPRRRQRPGRAASTGCGPWWSCRRRSGPSRAKTVPSRDVEVDAVENELLAERLAQTASREWRGRL